MLFKRKNSPFWWITFTTASGERIRQSAKTADKKKAQELADRLKTQCWDQVQLNHNPQHFWQEAVIRWLQETTKRSVDTDKYMLNWFRPYLDNKCLNEIIKDVIEHIIQAKLDEGCSQTRVNRVTLICSILNKARKEWEWIDTVPHIRKFPEQSKRIRWLTREEANRLMHELPDHLEAMA